MRTIAKECRSYSPTKALRWPGERFHVRTRATEYSNSRLSIAPSVVFLCNWDIARKKGEGIPKRFFRRSDNGHVYPELISTEKTVV
jgi:hypothetical protein